MNDSTAISVLTINLALLEVKLHALSMILVRSKLCSIEGIAAQTEEITTDHLAKIVQKSREQISALVKAMEQDGLSFETVVQRLVDHQDKWKLGPNDIK